MKAKVLVGSVVIVAIAGGLMFCGDQEIIPENEQNDRVENNTQREVPEGKGPLVEIQLGQLGTTTPSFWAVRIGDEWSRPPEYAGKVKVRLPEGEQEYAVAWACESGPKGSAAIHTTLVEATARELSTLNARCASEKSETVEVTGAIRNVGGQSPTLLVGTDTQVVQNEKDARDVLFSTNLPAGTHSFVAQVGDGEKAKFAAAREVEVKAGVNVEIDAATGAALQAKTWEITTDPLTDTRFGDAQLWIDGRTLAHAAKLEVTDDGVVAHTTGENADYIDLSADLHGAPKHARARARFIARSDRTAALPMPSLHWVGPTYARINPGLEVSWSHSNWSIVARSGEDLSLFMPIAYVATLEQAEPDYRFDLVVTPRRALGITPHFKVPQLDGIEGWAERFWYDADETFSVRAGNLTAWAGDDVAPDSATAITAYLDDAFTPAELGVEDEFAIVVAGATTVQPGDQQSISDLIEARCINFRGCEDTIYNTENAVESCPDLEAWADCEDLNELPEPPPYFADALKREIARWYANASIPNAVSLEEALAGFSADGVEPVASPSAPNLKVFRHADPSRPDSAAAWYGAYLNGRLVSVEPVNWDAELND